MAGQVDKVQLRIRKISISFEAARQLPPAAVMDYLNLKPPLFFQFFIKQPNRLPVKCVAIEMHLLLF